MDDFRDMTLIHFALKTEKQVILEQQELLAILKYLRFYKKRKKKQMMNVKKSPKNWWKLKNKKENLQDAEKKI